MNLGDVVDTVDAVSATPGRSAKRDLLAELLGVAAPGEVEPLVGLLVGEPRQGRIGIGWRTLAAVDVDPAPVPTLSVADLDDALVELEGLVGPGSAASRRARLEALLGACTVAERSLVTRLLTGELRQGALEGVLTEAIARAAGVPAAPVRRAHMMTGDLGETATLALGRGREALDAVGLRVLTPVRPMLAATSDSVAEAIAEAGLASVEWKLDGARIQVHRRGEEVRIATRKLNDVTARLPGVVELARTLPAEALVLDGEVLGVEHDGRPGAFQDTMSRLGRGGSERSTSVLTPWFFDVLHVDGTDLVDEPLAARRARLVELLGDGEHLVPGVITDQVAEAEGVLDAALDAGHEGVMVKTADSPYAAGRRGRAWRKVKPVATLDLVVLGAEWGSGRRTGTLSNLHLGARDPDGGWLMVGKTFKGLTDELLAWQTAELLAREVDREGVAVLVRPELVVEIGLDGAQSSPRYPGGVSLRFARVRRYRPDKDPSEADTIDAVRALVR